MVVLRCRSCHPTCACVAEDLWSWSHETHKVNINDLMKQKFEYTDHSGQFGIGEEDSLSVQEDPVNHGQYVLSVFYRQGTFTHHDHDGNNCPNICHRGAEFYVNQNTKSTSIIVLDGRRWKTPRWRCGGQGEVYAYMTHDQKAGTDFNSWCDSLKSREIFHKVGCSDHDGIGIGTGVFHFQSGKWIKLTQRVYVTLWVNDHAEIHMIDILIRIQFNFGIDGLFISTFYAETTILFSNFRLSTDAPQLVQSQLVG
ncbi:hypothetical protein ACJMK2_017110 [Sinanodonta woodiana]|uniref:Polysaccharide lyase 14 domain-containing protein n=1 Tax=Sinanodonta woodiana TaxID=1069815 RepID=A0ABD3UXW8_SINWO